MRALNPDSFDATSDRQTTSLAGARGELQTRLEPPHISIAPLSREDSNESDHSTQDGADNASDACKYRGNKQRPEARVPRWGWRQDADKNCDYSPGNATNQSVHENPLERAPHSNAVCR